MPKKVNKKQDLKKLVYVCCAALCCLFIGFGIGVYYKDHQTAKQAPQPLPYPHICDCPMIPAGTPAYKIQTICPC